MDRDEKIGMQEEGRDRNIVGWEDDEDPENPYNWTRTRKWNHVAIVALINFVTPLASSMFTPGVTQVQKEFGNYNHELSSFVVSVYPVEYEMGGSKLMRIVACGPLVLSPLSEIYGRLYIYHGSNIAFVCFTIGCAFAPSFESLIVFRFLAGCAGATGQTVGGGTIGDLFVQIERGLPMSLYTLGPVIGPAIGPVGGGFLAQAMGWRCGFPEIVTFLTMRETFAPALLSRKTALLIHQTGNPHLRSKLHRNMSHTDFLKLSMIRPIKLLFLSPIVTILSLFMGITYGYLYLLFTTFPVVFEGGYRFTTGTIGLAYIGTGVGCSLGTVITGWSTDRIMVHLSKNGERKPEYRLPMMIPGAVAIPIGLFWYGWSSEKGVQFMMPIIGTVWFGMGLMMIFMPITMYLVDFYSMNPPSQTVFKDIKAQADVVPGIYAASALAAATVSRAVVGAILPLAGESMYNALGLGWGNSLLAFIALAFCPVPILLFKYGERIRKRTKLNL
ncbi:MFS transporter cpaT [Hyphodiscus hymeniophilus]|uniref:MFS transporter cpaT n=1 Tax=Hyphodiscus hymeniophilus TaxID=353542 RepID=A0A9P6VK34_9HELO|nr:MFS transporter cpaT [Hyphodiscus hymeniophilus]